MTLPDRHPTINRGSAGADVDVGTDDDDDDADAAAAVEQRLVACTNGSWLSYNRRIRGLVATGILSVLLLVVPPLLLLLVAVEGDCSCAAAGPPLACVAWCGWVGGSIYDGSAGNGGDVAAVAAVTDADDG
jgi:hypothetical protein